MQSSTKFANGFPLGPAQIARLLPHAAPFLLVDQVLEAEPGVRGKGVKNVTGNDPFLQGHFPGKPIMPGVLIVEACGQLAAIVCALGGRAAREAAAEPQEADGGEKLEILAMIERFKFLKRVTPGDRLILEAVIGKRLQNMVRISVSARVGDGLVAEGVLVATQGV